VCAKVLSVVSELFCYHCESSNTRCDKIMTDPLDAMRARWNHVQSSLFLWLRENVEPMTELPGRRISIPNCPR
jgi:hypothetical protein